MLLAFTMIAAGCGAGPAAPAEEPLGVAQYRSGMWEARTMAVSEGLDRALAMASEGQDDRAVRQVWMVYRGSFEPELEPAARRYAGPRDALELEYRFGLVTHAIQDGGDAAGQAERLVLRMEQVARLLEERRATIP